VKEISIFGKAVPCGCESREEIMSAGNWKTDALIVGSLILITCCVIGKKWV
jgi:hypothetical protein